MAYAEWLIGMYYIAPGPLLWVTPLSAFATPVPPTASYYTVPTYYVPQAAPVAPVSYEAPMTYAPVTYAPMYEPVYYPSAPEMSLPRGEYRVGRCLLICQ